MTDEVKKSYPLDWPAGWKRTPSGHRGYGKFGKTVQVHNGESSWNRKAGLSVMDGIKRILEQMQKMGIHRDNIVISTNVPTRLDGLPRSDARKPEDPGSVIYWVDRTLPKGEQMRCMAIDQYTSVEDNLAAIAATLDAMRAIERHGGAEILNRAFTGFLALPEKATEPWRDVLDLKGPLTRDTVLARTRDLLLANNPDQGGDRDTYERIIEARKRALEEVK